VPNLFTDRAFWFVRIVLCLNVRRLMYQSLICSAVLRHQARRLRTTFNAKDLQRLADPLIDRMRRDSKLDRDFFGGKMSIDQTQAIELAGRQLRHPVR
jgi:hypothetical protein